MSTINFIPTENDYVQLPYLNDFFDGLEKYISKFVEEHEGADEVQLRRFGSGKLCQADYLVFQGRFKGLPEPAETSNWNALVAVEAEANDGEFSFTKECMQGLKRKYDQLGEDADLKAKVTAKKKKIMEQKKKGKKTSGSRVEMYQQHLKNLQKNINYMCVNYHQHMFLVGVNSKDDQQLAYQKFAYYNSGKMPRI